MGTPAGCWLICTMYMIALMQLISQPSLGGISAMQKVTGYIQDTSKCLHYHWWQQVYYLDCNAPYPSQSREKWAVGVVGLMTMEMFSPTSEKLVCVASANLRSSNQPKSFD